MRTAERGRESQRWAPRKPDQREQLSRIDSKACQGISQFIALMALDGGQVDCCRRYGALCNVDFYIGQPESVIACDDKAISLRPRDPERFLFIA
jgi:hypothetical protein